MVVLQSVLHFPLFPNWEHRGGQGAGGGAKGDGDGGGGGGLDGAGGDGDGGGGEMHGVSDLVPTSQTSQRVSGCNV